MAVQPQYDEIGSRRRLQQLVEDLSAGGGVGGDGSGGGGDGGNDDDRAKRIERVKRTVDQLCPLSSGKNKNRAIQNILTIKNYIQSCFYKLFYLLSIHFKS